METSRVIEDLRNILWRAEELSKVIETPYFKENSITLGANLVRLSTAFCGSWIGYHATVYYAGFRAPAPGHHFSIEWGLPPSYPFRSHTSGYWQECTREKVEAVAFHNVADDFCQRLTDASREASLAYNELRDSLQVILNILSEAYKTDTVAGYVKELAELKGPAGTFAQKHTVLHKALLYSRLQGHKTAREITDFLAQGLF